MAEGGYDDPSEPLITHDDDDDKYDKILKGMKDSREEWEKKVKKLEPIEKRRKRSMKLNPSVLARRPLLIMGGSRWVCKRLCVSKPGGLLLMLKPLSAVGQQLMKSVQGSKI